MDPDLVNNLTETTSTISVVDWVFLAYLGFGLIRGFFRGLADELAGLLGTLIVFVAGWRLYRPVSDMLLEHTRMQNEVPAQALAYVLLVVLFLVAWNLLIFILKKIGTLTFPKGLNILGGGFMGLAKCAGIICILLYAVNLSGIRLLQEKLVEETWTGRATQQVVPETLNRWIPALFPTESEEETESDKTPTPAAL